MINMDAITGRLGNRMFQTAFLYAIYRKGIIPDIYLQNETYFAEYKDDIKKLYLDGIVHLPYVAIHVRRATNPILPSEPAYSDNPFYVNLFENGYYDRAMKEFPDARFMVFSDDVKWCKKQNTFEGCEFDETKDDVEALNKMASCEGHIIANSSFSWWGAYLSPHGGKVVAPEKWFTDGQQRTGLLDSWIKI